MKSKNEQMFVHPRLFGLFPKPGLGWRVIKIDSKNIAGVFPEASLKREVNEPLFRYTQKRFHNGFHFANLEHLHNLPIKNGKMFLNGLYLDGYTCLVLFCRKFQPALPVEKVSLELKDFSDEEVNEHFRPCAGYIGRKYAFVSYHGSNDLRSLSSKEYYIMGSTIRRQGKEQEHKKKLGVEKIETNTPTPKTTSCQRYISHIDYMFRHTGVLFNFDGFRIVAIKWRNYIGPQKNIEYSVDILLNR
ncbi:hypothetical protein J3Q64DRAFT_1862305 [Phycomyces blakesleeanus]|uniref:Uncharacterized protein n=2 Tax=Phycomyces blakesleeanus TaxID=4837 RepID=A0A162PS31_PHYB8|nr:hypothetical protein PHYBLDRAFT_65570 [Phycomyces blakesleeanus NRRL 1555(-)]OAD72386.1 hypothetical protein PHYBLDRAFT_65570 [Phycomyces blakesleeanus NRRL 1555(-)]|eukprot:XP_018290426.1 hypothetical protein PHYBLDRAFT_65570 [Phycomyces blakesleeanus NRRL 1555(-)]